MPARKGDTVRQIVTPIQGVVLSKFFDEDADAFKLLVEFSTPDGGTSQAWYDEDRFEVVQGAAE